MKALGRSFLVVAVAFAIWLVGVIVIGTIVTVQGQTYDANGLANPLTEAQRYSQDVWTGRAIVTGAVISSILGVVYWLKRA